MSNVLDVEMFEDLIKKKKTEKERAAAIQKKIEKIWNLEIFKKDKKDEESIDSSSSPG